MNEKFWQIGYAGGIGLLLLLLLHHHWQIISAPVPLDLYEGTMPLITGIIADGYNPYTRPFQPYATDVYPPLYNLLVAPLSLVFGNTFALHRAVSAVFILLAASLCAWTAWRRTGNRLHAGAVGSLVYAALLFYATPVSSTNAPGVFLFLSGLLLPWLRRFSTPSLLVALLCGLLGFYTKQYFILGMAILCLYLFLYVSMRRALLLGTAFAVLLAVSLWLVHTTSPYYLDNTVFAPAAAIQGLQSWAILGMQLRFFALTYLGILALLAVCLLLSLKHGSRSAAAAAIKAHFQLARAGIRGPLLCQRVDYFWFCLCWSSLAIVGWLGKNPGNYMTYLFQLISPFLLIAALACAATRLKKSWLLVPLLFLNGFQAYAILHKDFSADMDNWARIESIVRQSDEILATQMLVMTLLENDKKVYQDGHTFYFPSAIGKPAWFVKARAEDRVETVWRDYITELYRKIERREFDAILVSPWEMRGIFLRNPPPFEEVTGREFLSRYYRMEEKIPLSMTRRHGGGEYDVMVWRPRQARVHP